MSQAFGNKFKMCINTVEIINISSLGKHNVIILGKKQYLNLGKNYVLTLGQDVFLSILGQCPNINKKVLGILIITLPILGNAIITGHIFLKNGPLSDENFMTGK